MTQGLRVKTRDSAQQQEIERMAACRRSCLANSWRRRAGSNGASTLHPCAELSDAADVKEQRAVTLTDAPFTDSGMFNV
ncbi:hypothetical protein CesoFtcFv8_018302 [Champsocephalus esox]|uniref:Uncharacterized protein n=1 Tax=Champsocephalus esox TaxID=159716 RepID=A0AAN8BGT1_9TELE|nr:hypothetical protein CesoFtcFv8_018302 [Champsocephalus esox]